MKRLIRSKFMTWHAYAFDRYKQQRNAAHPADFRHLHCPTIPGLVSIVLPVHNGERYVREALDSILAQTYSNFELIAVNDGSSDKSGEILDQYAANDSRIRVVHQTNQKLPRSLSNGFNLARGEYLTWTSDDNRLKPDFLACMLDCLNRHPTWDMVYANPDIIGDDGKPLLQSDWYKPYQRPTGSQHIHLPTDPSALNLDPNNYVGAAFLYRDRVGWLLGDYSPNRFTMEDYDYWMQVNNLFHLRHADFKDQLYEYRFHSQSLTSRDNDLGITSTRPKMMVFDTFRRDLYLAPLVWFFESGHLQEQAFSNWQQLEHLILSNGHMILPREETLDQSIQHLWMPAIYAYAWQGENSIPTPPQSIPEWILKVLVVVNPENELPQEVPASWDMCIVFTANHSLYRSRLSKPYQGWFSTNNIHTLFTSIDIRCRVEHLHRIEQEAFSPPVPLMKYSIVICTYRRGKLLLESLYALARQTIAKDTYEVIVVNNDPQDEQVAQWVENIRSEEFADRSDRLRLVVCPVPGLSNARNAGIAESHGKVVCFIDDDAIPQPDWLEQIDRLYQERPQVGIGGGQIQLVIPEPRPDVLRPGMEHIWSHFTPPYSQYTPVKNWWEFPWGANWFSLRQALVEIGGFRTRYGRVKKNYSGGEEMVAAGLARQLGYEVGILPSAIVAHKVESHRFNKEHVWRTVTTGITTAYQAQKDFYISYDLTLLSTIKSIVFQTLKILGLLLLLRFREAKITGMHWIGYLRLFKEHIGDFFARFRKPVSCREPVEFMRTE